MSKCPFISREEALHYANWEGAYKVALLIEDVPDPDPEELIAAAIKQLDSEGLFRNYLKLSECLFRSIKDRHGEDTITIGHERPGVKLEVSITVKEDKNNE